MENAPLHAITVFMGFFAIMNPIANVPIFLGLTSGDDEKTTAAVAFRSLALAFLIIVIFSIAGKVIFDLFGITLPAFRITGGLLVFLIGFHMLQGDHSSVQHPGDVKGNDPRNFSANGGLTAVVITIAAFGILCVVTYAFFLFGEKFVTYIGSSALGAITRLMGLILAVIGTQMVVEGINGIW